MKLPRNFRPLRSRNFRLYFIGQTFSMIGTWMTQAASLWLVYHLTGSTVLLGTAGFATLMPSFILGPIGGVWVDRVASRRRVLAWTQTLSMLQSLSLAALALSDTITVSHIIGLSIFQGIVNAFDLPARQAALIEMVRDKEDLGGAIALNAALFNLARLIGPAIGGLVVARWGAGQCFLIDGFSYVFILVALALIKIPTRTGQADPKHPFVEVKEGFAAAFGFAPIRVHILMVCAISFFGFSFSVLTPVFANDIYKGDASVLGYLMASAGCGALIGALYLGSRRTVKGLGSVISAAAAVLGLALVGFAFSRWLPLSYLCLGFVGCGGVLVMASCNTLIQSMVDDDKRGRVIAIFAMGYTGLTPLGNLLVGTSAAHIGVVMTTCLCGVCCIISAFAYRRVLPELLPAAYAAIDRKNT